MQKVNFAYVLRYIFKIIGKKNLVVEWLSWLPYKSGRPYTSLMNPSLFKLCVVSSFLLKVSKKLKLIEPLLLGNHCNSSITKCFNFCNVTKDS